MKAEIVSLCEACWRKHHSEREPHRVIEASEETCYLCGVLHRSGIYVRVEKGGE